MQVKVCAKCGAENKETNDSCSSCYASLADARTAESTKEPIVLPPEPAERPERRPTETPTPAAQMPPPGPPVAVSVSLSGEPARVDINVPFKAIERMVKAFSPQQPM